MPTLSAEPDVSELGRLRDDLRPRQQTLRARFDALRGKVRSRLAAEGIAWALLYAAAAFFGTLLLDWQFRFGVGARRALALAAVAGLVYLVYRGIVQPLRSRWTELDLARFLDRKRPGTSEQVAALLQLPELLHARSGASAAMVQAAVEENAHRLENAVFADYLDRSRAKKHLALAGAAVLAAAAFAAAQPFYAGLWWKRFALGASLNWPQRTFLEIQGLGPDGAFHAPRGEPLPLRVSAVEKLEPVPGGYQAPGRADVFAFPPGKDPAPQPPEQVRIQLDTAAGARTRATFTKLRPDLFQYELAALSEVMTASITGGDDRRGPFKIIPVDRPAVAALKVLATPPGSGGPPAESDGLTGQQLHLVDTKLDVTIVGSTPLKSVAIKPDAGPVPSLERISDDSFRARWTMKDSQTFEITLVSADYGLASRPTFVTFGLLKDRPPRATMQATGVGRRITPIARVPLVLRIQDDFGLRRVAVESESAIPTDTTPKVLKSAVELFSHDGKGEKPPAQFDKNYEYQIEKLKVPPGATVQLKAAAEDDCIQGKQRGESRALAFQIVQPDELFYEILTRQRAERARFQTATNTAETHADALEKAKDSEPVPAAARAAQAVDREIWQTANRLEATLVEMRLNGLGNPQMLEILESKVIQAIRTLRDDKLAALREKLLQAQADPTAVPDARKLQRDVAVAMKKILDQMAQWEGFVDVVNQLRQIITLETGVLKKSDENKGKVKPKDDIFDDKK